MDPITKFLEKISYKFPNGYPDMNNEQDILLIENELNKLGINLNEASLNYNELKKPFVSKSSSSSQYNDRGEKFLDKILNGEEFELQNGSLIKIDKEKSQKAIDLLKNKNYEALGGANKIFITTSGEALSLPKFKKTSEFGSSSGQGGGTVNTAIAESSQCIFNALAYYVVDEISDETLTPENYKKAYSYCDVTNSLEEIVEFSQDKSWRNTFILTAQKLKQTLPNNNFTFHRGSTFTNSIYNAYKLSMKKEDNNMQSDKWNPSDIWMVDKSVLGYEFPDTLEELNADLLNLFTEEKLIGVSLKKLGGSANLSYYNITSQDIKGYTIEKISAIPSNKGGQVEYNGGKIYFRTFNFADNFAGEILGKTAAHGKIGTGPLNNILKYNNRPQFPNNKELRKNLENNDSDTLKIFSENFEKINGKTENFLELIKEKNIDWKFSKYLALHICAQIQDNGEELLSDILRYSTSSTKQSSVFIKIS
jgi:hypothetical protein